MLGESELTALEALYEPTTVSGLAERLDRSQSYVSEVVTRLTKKGLVRKEQNGREKLIIPSDSKAVELYLDLSMRYSHIDFPELLSGPTIPLLYYLDEPISIAELAERTDNYRNTVHRRVKLLRVRTMIRKDGTRYQLKEDFQILNQFAREYIHHVHRQCLLEATDGYRIIWENHESFLVQTDQEVNNDSFLATGPERFGEYGVKLFTTGTRYYVYPAEQIDFSPEELVCHMLLINSGTRFRSYCLLLLSGVTVNEELLKSRATHYGVSELIEQLLNFLKTKGELTAEPLPNWDEFQALADQYGVSP